MSRTRSPSQRLLEEAARRATAARAAIPPVSPGGGGAGGAEDEEGRGRCSLADRLDRFGAFIARKLSRDARFPGGAAGTANGPEGRDLDRTDPTGPEVSGGTGGSRDGDRAAVRSPVAAVLAGAAARPAVEDTLVGQGSGAGTVGPPSTAGGAVGEGGIDRTTDEDRNGAAHEGAEPRPQATYEEGARHSEGPVGAARSSTRNGGGQVSDS